MLTSARAARPNSGQMRFTRLISPLRGQLPQGEAFISFHPSRYSALSFVCAYHLSGAQTCLSGASARYCAHQLYVELLTTNPWQSCISARSSTAVPWGINTAGNPAVSRCSCAQAISSENTNSSAWAGRFHLRRCPGVIRGRADLQDGVLRLLVVAAPQMYADRPGRGAYPVGAFPRRDCFAAQLGFYNISKIVKIFLTLEIPPREEIFTFSAAPA